MPRSTPFRARLRLRPESPASISCIVSFIVLCLVLDGVPPAFAEKADREKNIEFQGDTGGGNAETKTGELVGHVIITQGTMTIQADRVTFQAECGRFAVGNCLRQSGSLPRKARWRRPLLEGFAQRIVYDGSTRFIELFENALLKKAGDEIRSNYITYSAATEKFTAEGRPDAKPPAAGDVPLGARVRGTFQPRSDDKAGKAAAKEKDKDKADATPDKDKGKGAATKAAVPLTLQQSGDLAPAK